MHFPKIGIRQKSTVLTREPTLPGPQHSAIDFSLSGTILRLDFIREMVNPIIYTRVWTHFYAKIIADENQYVDKKKGSKPS